MKKYCWQIAVVLVLAMMGLIVAGCGENRPRFAGTYKSAQTYAGEGNITLNLMQDGRVTWTLAEKTVEFTWVI